ncbi:MAG: hypothetical protein K0U98_02505 [Deltaproteobacteria bacterium]|nr:hypothetical protein [Deltaproteobacteria bacterium]
MNKQAGEKDFDHPIRNIDRLIFVYKADTGKVNALLDSAKKLLMIKGCTLCSITHGLAGEKEEWRNCREEIGVPVEIFHRDEIDSRLGKVVRDQLPVVVAETVGDLVVLLTPEVLERCKGSVHDFKARLRLHSSMRNLAIPGL